jgi:SAM-dependent methyltransferase
MAQGGVADDLTYEGGRILGAMRAATRYSDAVFDLLRESVPPGAGALLDFGAGSGAFAERFERRGMTVDGVEPDSRLNALLRAGGRHVVRNLAEVASGSYRMAYAINVLEHIENPIAACADIHRVLVPGGVFFAYVPAFRSLWTSLDDEVRHFRRYTRRTLAEQLVASGFRIERSGYFDPLGLPAALAVRLLEKAGAFRYNAKSIAFYDRFIFPMSRRLAPLLRGIGGKNVYAVARRD